MILKDFDNSGRFKEINKASKNHKINLKSVELKEKLTNCQNDIYIKSNSSNRGFVVENPDILSLDL